ncbi:MAG: ATPase [Deltaproteobacteria bacterium]|nr:ATPase [Deltaproteobacteria bacterium]
MASRSIREYDGKKILDLHFREFSTTDCFVANPCVQLSAATDLDAVVAEHPWLLNSKLVAKPDQLIKRRGNSNLVLLNAGWDEVVRWVFEHMNKSVAVDGITGILDTFIVECFVPHEVKYEYYLAIRSVREGDEILFFRQGGVEIGDVDSISEKIVVKVFDDIDALDLDSKLLKDIGVERRPVIASFIKSLYKLYVAAGFSYAEINPLAFVDGRIVVLDFAAKLDDTAEFEGGKLWAGLTFPPPFGRLSTNEERHINHLDAQSGASLKFTVLNPQGRVWTMVAGGGASVIFADTVVDLGYGEELANYGEYSGNPTDEETYDYARTVIGLMTQELDPKGREKILLIGGGIANFTDVAKTFNGICRAIKEYSEALKRVKAKIYVRRGGPNYVEGLSKMQQLGLELGLPMEVYGPELHMTKIVSKALTV